MLRHAYNRSPDKRHNARDSGNERDNVFGSDYERSDGVVGLIENLMDVVRANVRHAVYNGTCRGCYGVEENTHKYGKADEVPVHVPAVPVYLRTYFNTGDIQKGSLGAYAASRPARKLRKD